MEDINNKEKINIKRIFNFVIKFILVIIWMIAVFKFSSEVGDDSSNTSGVTITKILTFFKHDWKIDKLNSTVELLQPYARKLAHFTLYALGGFLIYNLKVCGENKRKNLLFTILVGAIYSISDEIHQLFVPGRSGLITDVLIDTLGIIVGGLFYILIFKYVKKVKNIIKHKKINK